MVGVSRESGEDGLQDGVRVVAFLPFGGLREASVGEACDDVFGRSVVGV